MTAELLPTALGLDDDEVRAALAPVLGERGRWLGQFREDWGWVLDPSVRTTSETDDAPPAAAETVWEEGSVKEPYASS